MDPSKLNRKKVYTEERDGREFKVTVIPEDIPKQGRSTKTRWHYRDRKGKPR